jgi:archaellum biogenesis ATPase FlaH
MACYAFVLGVNSLGLKYAESDAKNIAEVLRQYNYEIKLLPPDLALLRDVLQEIVSSRFSDTVIFYFAGHGEVINNDLYLFLNNLHTASNQHLPISFVTQLMRQSAAKNKLLILDCCRAGKAFEEFTINLSEPYLVLSASGITEKSREFESLRAGFFTHHLCEVLKNPSKTLLNEQGELSVNDLCYKHLKPIAEKHNRENEVERVPLPKLAANNDFSLITIDTKKETHANILSERSSSDPLTTENFIGFDMKKLTVKESFLKFLENVELLTKAHSGKNTVVLSDIFVYPELEEYDDLKDDFRKENAEKLIKNFQQYSKILIAGENQSGKTTLCKKFFTELLEINLIPVYISDNKRQYAGKIQNRIREQFQEQYEGIDFNAIDSNIIVPIIDDFHFAKNKERLINELSIYQYSVIIVDDIFSLNFKNESLTESFHQIRIKECSPSLRNILIEKWVSLSDNKNIIHITPNEHYQKLDCTTEFVNCALGKIIGSGIMPAYPFFILSIISTHDALESPINQEITSQAHCYQALIYFSLRKEGVKPDEIDTYINFLTVFSFFLYEDKKSEASKEELNQFIKKYKIKYIFPPKQDVFLTKLINSRIIILDNLGNYQFNYLYVYYFFVAKYISENIDSETQKIDFIANNLHKDENAYIAVFISHHSKKSCILEKIKQNAYSLFSEWTPANLSKEELSFFDSKLDNIIKEVLPSNNTKPEIERADRLRNQDNIESSDDTNGKIESFDTQEDSFSIELRRSIKTVEVMGLIIKNRAGSLEITELENMFEEGMNVYLRILKSFFDVVEHNEETIIHFIYNKLEPIANKFNGEKIEDKILNIPPKELEKISRKIFWNMNFFVIYNIINKIIHSLGSNQLIEITKTVCDKKDTPAAFLIKHGVLMWYNKNIQSENISKKINEENFSETAKKVMRCMIVNYCSLHSVNFKEKQRLSEKLNIKLIKMQRNRTK